MQEEDAALEEEKEERAKEERAKEEASLSALLSSPQDQNRCVCGRDETGTQLCSTPAGVGSGHTRRSKANRSHRPLILP